MILAEIQTSLLKAQKGVSQYAQLMRQFPHIDVSSDKNFQRAYNAFYRVQRRQESWYSNYYSLMQRLKEKHATFDEVLDEIHRLTGRYEPSFASKLIATINPEKPIWDIHILSNTGHQAPSYTNKNKLSLAKEAYKSIEKWYASFIKSADGETFVSEFNRMYPMHSDFSDLKKVDFILWQTRK